MRRSLWSLLAVGAFNVLTIFSRVTGRLSLSSFVPMRSRRSNRLLGSVFTHLHPARTRCRDIMLEKYELATPFLPAAGEQRVAGKRDSCSDVNKTLARLEQSAARYVAVLEAAVYRSSDRR